MPRPGDVAGLSKELPAREAAHRLTAARLGDVRRCAETLVGAPTADAVHDLRVAVRRLRAALELFGAGDAWVDELKRLMAPLGSCRDAQLRLEWLKAAGAARGALYREEERRLAVELPLAVARVRAWLRARPPAFETLARELAPAGKFGGHRLRERLASLRGQVDRRAAKLDGAPDPRAAHQLRIRAKRLRYAAELLERADPGPVHRLLRDLPHLQSLLGELHDADVRVDWLSHATVASRAERERLLERAQADRKRLARRLERQLH